MKLPCHTAFVACLFATPLSAESLCDRPAEASVLAELTGDWLREGAISFFSETLDTVRPVPSERGAYVITPDQALDSRFIDSVAGAPQPLHGLATPAYDVDRVDDLLDTTGQAGLADVLSDTLCGPEALPQWQAPMSVIDRSGMRVEGTMTVIGYFTDRLLLIGEIELRSEDALIFMTETMLLRPDAD